MSERFDSLFEGMSEEIALDLLSKPANSLSNPGLKYTAASRLAASTSPQSLQALVRCLDLSTDDLIEKITRRKAIEALGRRRDPNTLPLLLSSLEGHDEIAVVDAVDAIVKIGHPLDPEQQSRLAQALNGPDNQRRAVIQAHTRLQLKAAADRIAPSLHDENCLVSGAARAYRASVHGETELLEPLIQQLVSEVAGHRRAAVIDLGDAGDCSVIKALAQSPVSMPLRAKSAIQLLTREGALSPVGEEHDLLAQLLQDDPRTIHLNSGWIPEPTAEAVESSLMHRDEARQYGAMRVLYDMDDAHAIAILRDLFERRGSDYGVHYFVTALIGLKQLHELQQLLIQSLHETRPQYSKSRVAAAWGCQSMNLQNELPLLKELEAGSRWLPLKWSCHQIVKKMQQRAIDCNV